MIETVTLNPSLDYTVMVPNFATGRINRAESVRFMPGGKGINVSRILKALEFPVRNLCFTAGFTGEELEEEVLNYGIPSDFVRLRGGMTRVNVKLRHDCETDVNTPGPEVTEEAVADLYEKISHLSEGDGLVLAGSVPPGVAPSIYAEILRRVRGTGIRCVVDTSGLALKLAVVEKPFLVKPNREELGELFSRPADSPETVLQLAKQLHGMGPENVLISLGGDGALLAASDGNIYVCEAPKGEAVNSVGAGDSMVAGFLEGWIRKENYFKEMKRIARRQKRSASSQMDKFSKDTEELELTDKEKENVCMTALARGVAAGSASAFSEDLADRQAIEELSGEVKPMKL